MKEVLTPFRPGARERGLHSHITTARPNIDYGTAANMLLATAPYKYSDVLSAFCIFNITSDKSRLASMSNFRLSCYDDESPMHQRIISKSPEVSACMLFKGGFVVSLMAVEAW